jgi:hypothetical protein
MQITASDKLLYCILKQLALAILRYYQPLSVWFPTKSELKKSEGNFFKEAKAAPLRQRSHAA